MHSIQPELQIFDLDLFLGYQYMVKLSHPVSPHSTGLCAAELKCLVGALNAFSIYDTFILYLGFVRM
jgi:hypothetical protein